MDDRSIEKIECLPIFNETSQSGSLITNHHVREYINQLVNGARNGEKKVSNNYSLNTANNALWLFRSLRITLQVIGL